MNGKLQNLLSMSDARRKALIRTWVSDLLIAGVPKNFIAAIVCLEDDKVAEKAYEVIFNYPR